jgi:60 kDa SS-A/Ro ribonucleoprotein
MKIYSRGHSEKGAGRWSPVAPVVDALDDAFYLSFGAITPTGTRQLLALDVSGSMTMSQIAGLPITPREASAALAMVTVRTEPSCAILAFDDQLTELTISPRQRLDDVVRTISDRPFQRTDCALPMLWALHKKLPIDAIQIYTDSETWYGNTHPSQALRQYRQQMGIPTKLIVHGMTSTGFSIAPPGDDSCLDVCGFDLAVPQVVSEFITGTI